MNERILELAKQCGYWSGQTIEMNDVGIAKFAELIVRECANKVVEHQPRYLTRGQAQEMADMIKQHFGVEE